MAAPRAFMRVRRAGQAMPNKSSTMALSSTPILDFLLPSYLPRPGSAESTLASRGAGRRFYSVAAPAATVSTQTRTHRRRRALAPAGHCQQTVRQFSSSGFGPAVSTAAAVSSRSQQHRTFATTQSMNRTETVLNPQMDEDGNEMKLEITPRAAKRLSKVMEKDGNPRMALRIQVESGGCHGFQYLMSIVSLPSQLPAPNTSSSETAAPSSDAAESASDSSEGSEPVVREDDTIFAYVAEEGETVAGDGDPLSGPKIILDTPSLELLKGSKVDFTMELIGSQFKIVDNPLATSSCGCGTSFDIKV